ncbi:hypothetical protein Tco_1144867 [Tanacetum coccineum]
MFLKEMTSMVSTGAHTSLNVQVYQNLIGQNKKNKKDVVYYGPVMFLMFKKLQVKRRVPTFKSWNTSLWKKRETIELENLWMGMTDIQEVIDEGEETAQREPIQLMERMKEIFKEPHIPEHYSSSSTESDDDNDDVHNGSELGDDNQRSYGSYSDSSDEDYIRMDEAEDVRRFSTYKERHIVQRGVRLGNQLRQKKSSERYYKEKTAIEEKEPKRASF